MDFELALPGPVGSAKNATLRTESPCLIQLKLRFAEEDESRNAWNLDLHAFTAAISDQRML